MIYISRNHLLGYISSSATLHLLTYDFVIQFVLQQYDNPLSKKLNDLVNEIRRQRCSYLRYDFLFSVTFSLFLREIITVSFSIFT